MIKNPLRYPGAKATLIPYITDVIKDNYLEGCTFIEPYAGSAIASLELVSQGIASNAIIVELDPLIYSFWQSVFNHKNELLEKIYNTEISLENWIKFSEFKNTCIASNSKIVDVGFAGLFLNRTSFSGILKAGPLGGFNQESEYKIDCRFNKERLIKQIELISNMKNEICVINDDAIKFLSEKKKYINSIDAFTYIDPPYFIKGPKLYRYFYKLDDHKNLARFLCQFKSPWLVSYDNTIEIKKMYSKAIGVREIYFDYSAGGTKVGKELLISNQKIPPFSQEKYINDLA